jgi:8-amino-7-oxononanoate synthase
MDPQHKQRKRIIIKPRRAPWVSINQKQVINFANNDYLGLSNAMQTHSSLAHNKLMAGSGGSAMVCGYTQMHHEVEKSFASWLGFDKAMLFHSGYAANIGVISALNNRFSTIYADKYVHASILDGMRLSRAKFKRYQHCNLQHLTALCEQKKPTAIITESVFSMEGDCAPIPGIINLAKTYNAKMIIDDAHGIGVPGIGMS